MLDCNAETCWYSCSEYRECHAVVYTYNVKDRYTANIPPLRGLGCRFHNGFHLGVSLFRGLDILRLERRVQ